MPIRAVKFSLIISAKFPHYLYVYVISSSLALSAHLIAHIKLAERLLHAFSYMKHSYYTLHFLITLDVAYRQILDKFWGLHRKEQVLGKRPA